MATAISAAEKQPDGWVNLLERDSLELWEPGPSKAKTPTKEIGNRWSLKEGILKLDRGAESGRGGQIATKKTYFNFDLKFEFNIAHNGNSGVKYRVANVDGEAIGCEYQIIDDDNYRDNKNPTHRTACLYELVAVPAERKWNPAGQWNEGRIRVSGNTFEHWLNGAKVMSIEFGSADWQERFAKSKYKVHPDFAKNAGPIVLTDHGDSVSYRNVLIRELETPAGADSVKPEKTKEKKSADSDRKKGKGSEAPVAAIAEPAAFTANCKACHLLDQGLVGPSLVELAELYPAKDRAKFIQWTLTPGKKREHMPQMPSMAHIPEPQLQEIYDYIKTVTVGVSRVKTSNVDPYATAPAKTKRPRIERTFVPESGPASLILALPTTRKHNVIWDTDQCRLRYVSTGEPDNYPYLRSNGNALATVGNIIYRETAPVFSGTMQFQGYHMSKDGYPSFVYRVGDSQITETYSVVENAIVRTVTASAALPTHQLPKDDATGLGVKVSSTAQSFTVTYSAK